MTSRVGAVVIGRNEGERLAGCLRSVLSQAGEVVYVDSASTDGSLETARGLGLEAVGLDPTRPLSAARARNEGFTRLRARASDLDFVHFVDGDCELVEGWIEHAVAFLEAHPGHAIAAGRLFEMCPEASVYNRLAQIEWDAPEGEVTSCGGIFLIRISVFEEVGGFDASVPVCEEPELCRRVIRAGWRIRRLPSGMARHDSAMTSFRQWWSRLVRNGRGALDVTRRFGLEEFARQCRSARIWTAGWGLATALASFLGALLMSPAWGWILGGLVALSLPVQILRVALQVRARTGLRVALLHGLLTMAGKWPHLLGQAGALFGRRRVPIPPALGGISATEAGSKNA